ncbi:MAG: endonuclease [Nitrospira bacterium SG8_35_4]|nr:MAG: endonuclease [Nitrospira bacterium SG8_35_4]
MTKPQSKNILIDIYDALFDKFGPQDWWPGDSPFEIAVGAILTQNTNWANVEKAIQNLKREKCLNAKKLLAMPHTTLASFIKPAGYFNVKAKRLKNFLSLLSNHYEGSMKRMQAADTVVLRKSLLDVNGIGPETADSILLYALGRPVFVIDAYTRRVLHRHGIVSEDATYHEMQELFHGSLPEDVQRFNEYHALFVMTGKHYCKPNPRCGGCPLEPLLSS